MLRDNQLGNVEQWAEERDQSMSESLTDLINEETFGSDVPDAALEVAAGKYWEVGYPFTITFCSGPDSCTPLARGLIPLR
jgi:hypothetical protein